MELNEAQRVFRVPPSNVLYNGAFEEVLVAHKVGWQAFYDATPQERAVMIAAYRTENTLEAVLYARANIEAEAKAKHKTQ